MKKPTEREWTQIQKQNLFLLNHEVDLEGLKKVADFLPGVIHINRGSDLLLQWISHNVRYFIPVTATQIIEQGFSAYRGYIHPDTIQYVFPLFKDFYQLGGDRQVMAHVQKILRNAKYQKMYTTTMNTYKHTAMVAISIPAIDLLLNRRLAREITDDPFVRKHYAKYEQLTWREKEVLRSVALGATNHQIADQWQVSPHTVRTHRNRIYRKLEIKSLTEAIRYAQHFRLI